MHQILFKFFFLHSEFPNAFIRDPILLHCILSFNAIAPTMMMKVLTKINNSPKVHSCYKKISKSEIENIVADSLGDAINSMQFMCMSYFKKPLSVQGSVSSSEDGSKSDSSLFLFHALGKNSLLQVKCLIKHLFLLKLLLCFCKRITFPLLMTLKLTLNVHIG
nr:uncharacterized protein LOC107436735 isoform X11 [Parasteatoda tepidariorum]